MEIKITRPKIIAGIDFGTTQSLVKTEDYFNKIYSNLYFYDEDIISSDLRPGYLEVIYSIKRLIDKEYILVLNKKYYIIDLIVILLKELLHVLLLKHEIIAVVTVPAKFNYHQRSLIAQAFEKLNIKIIRMIAEPTAAAFLYSKNGKFLVYDLGGGTFDLSYVKVKGMLLRVLETEGDAYLGGDDLDNQIAKEYNISSLEAKQKKELNLVSNIDDLIYKVFAKTLDIVNKYSEDIPLILVGGGSILAKSLFQNRKNVITDLHFTNAVVEGAFLYAKSFLHNHKFLLVDILPISIGIETFGGQFEKVLFRNSPLPITEEKIFTNQISGQKSIKFNIYQGENTNINDCKLLTQVQLDDLPPKLPGDLVIKTLFRMNLNGMFEFKAFCEDKECSANYDLYQGLEDDEIKKIISDYNDEQEEVNLKYSDILSQIYSIIRLKQSDASGLIIKSKPSYQDLQELIKFLNNLLL